MIVRFAPSHPRPNKAQFLPKILHVGFPFFFKPNNETIVILNNYKQLVSIGFMYKQCTTFGAGANYRNSQEQITRKLWAEV